MEQEVKIVWEGKKVVVVMTNNDMTWGQYKDINQKCIVIKEHNGEPMQFRNTDLMEDLIILNCIKSAPFSITLENLNKLSIEDRTTLSNVDID